MNKRKSRKAKEQLNVTFHHEKDFTGLSSNKIMSLTQVPRSLWLTASCTFIRQCDTKPRGLLSDRVSSRKLAVLIPLFMSGTEKKFWSDGILQQCHLHPLGAGWTWDMGRFVRRLCCAPACGTAAPLRSRGSRVLPSTALHDAHAGQLLPGRSCVCRAGKSQRDGRMIYRLSDFVYILFLFLWRA